MEISLLAITPNSQKIIEEAGRTCYLSFDKMGADSSEDFIRKIVRAGHESVLEHASATFRIKGCSRAMTHQLVRHRIMSFSQQSQRYVDEDAFDYVVPESLPEEYIEDFRSDMETINAMYAKWRERGLRKEDARFVLPNACCSEIVVSGNFRQWRHVIQLRISPKAQWEIRQAASHILNTLSKEAPACFCDLQAELKNN
ncbi:FAD-dependent thymidylate synthase [Sedimentisphaera salicampi]|uniref:Flavin-dependent thymidylate synthase n=1 Tax=Sedimentisphaera salicampi TaxID=1941349 RepID=A0A1W6LLI2_9BACT|nr:FAD-dependent thymidylate synthase [Sedimentisphaera salicampi]ARN56631.1 Thymidylate synthase ThyX [Sedimentisphaera salicampi]OXU15521.1 Thymidylate synthase ThyX [Sedimentisphaera salicampi]